MSNQIIFDFFNAAEVYENLDKFSGRIKMLKPALKAFGEDVRGNIVKNMRQGKSFDGTPFQELGPLSLLSRRKKSNIPLSDTGILGNSIGVQMQDDISVSIIAGFKNKVPYARLHQYGGKITAKKKFLTIPINPKARGRSASSFKDLFFYPNKKQIAKNPTRWKNRFLVRVKSKKKLELMYLLKESVNVPARPYMGFSKDASERFRQTVIKALVG